MQRKEKNYMQLSDEELKKILLEVSRRVSAERKQRGMSMTRLAEVANLSVSHVSKIEAEQCEIGLRALLKISMAFGIKPEKLLPECLSEMPRALTNGERFERIMKGADAQTIEIVLEMSSHMVNALEKKK